MEFKNPSTTVDVVVERENKIALIERENEPYKSYWALPGGFIEYGKENLEQAATRELYEETHLVVEPDDLELFWVSSEPGRDPRGHIISHFYATKKFHGELNAGDDASKVYWISLEKTPKLAFDHNLAIEKYKIWRKKMKDGKFKKPSVTADLVIEDNGKKFFSSKKI